LLFGGECADDFGGRSHDERAWRHLRVLGHESSGGDGASGTDAGSIENDGPHADEHLVFHGAGVDDGTMTNGDTISEDAGMIIADMQHGAVLDIGLSAHDNAVDVTPEDTAKPNAGFFTEIHGTDDDGAWSDECAVRDGGAKGRNQELFQGWGAHKSAWLQGWR